MLWSFESRPHAKLFACSSPLKKITTFRWYFLVLRAVLNDIRTLYEERDPEFLKTLKLVREITEEMEGNDEPPQALAA